MPDTLELDSSWTVALSNIIYPFSFSLLGDSEEQESITIYRRYGKELLSVRIEIPDLSFASEEALEEAINAILLDAWKKELDREREEMRLEENKKRIYGNFRKRRAVETISEQLVKNGYFDLSKEISFNFMKFLGKQGIRLPPISPHAIDGIEMVRFTPNQDQIELIKQALDEFTNPPSANQNEEHSTVTPIEETIESTPQTHPEVEQKEKLPTAEYESFIQQLETEGYFDMPKDRAYKFIQYLNKEIKGAKLPVLSSVPESSVETVRLKPQTEQKDIIINAIKSFASTSPSEQKSENPLQEEVENYSSKTEEDNSKEDLEKTESLPTSDETPIPKSPVKDAPTEAPVVSEEKSDDIQQDTEKQKDKTPLDGKITPLSDTLTDEQKTLIDMAVRAATRSLTNSVGLAKQQSQLNKALNQKYWEDARYNYALIDEEVTDGVIPKRKIPATILKWVITQLKLLVGRRNEINKWIQECLDAKDSVSEAQKETVAAESRGDVTEARKAADRAKAAEQKVKGLANQVDEAVAGQKILSEEIVGKVEAELSKQDDETSSSKITTPDDEELSSHEKNENFEKQDKHGSEEPKEHSEDKQENAKEPSTHEEENIEEEAESINEVAEQPSEDKYEKDEEPSAPAEEEIADEEHEDEEPHGTSEDTQENAKEPSTHEEENNEEEAESNNEVAEEPSEDTQEKDEDPSTIVEAENIELHDQEVTEETSEEILENVQESTAHEDEKNIKPREEIEQEVTETPDETSEEILENVQESTTHEDEKNIEPREEIEQEVTEEHVESSKEKIQEFPGVINEDKEPWTPPLEEPVPHSRHNLEDNESHELPTINEEDAVEPWSPEKEGLGKPQESPAIINKEVARTPPEKVSNLPTIEEEPEQDEIQTEDLSSLPELPRPEMLIADPPERPSFWKSFFGDGGRHVEELPHQENEHQQTAPEDLNDSEPKKLHLAEYAYPPEYLKMLLSFSNIQLADPKYQWVSILYDKVHKRFHVFLQGNVQFIKLSRQLAYTLGFDSEKVHSGQVAKYMPDISGGVRQFLVYAPKLVENSIIGNVTAPLLRVVNVSGGPGESISEVYMTEHHHRLRLHDMRIFVKQVDLSMSLNNAIARHLEQSPAKYAYRKIEIRSVFLGKGRQEITHAAFTISFSNIQLADPKYQWVSILYDKVQHQNIFIFHSQRFGFDNRFRSCFTLLGKTFSSVEQFFIWQKARFFGDLEIAEEVLMLDNPITIRRIGKRIRGYNQIEWNSVRNKVMYTGLWAKFTQNMQLFNQLRATNDGLIAQASASELYWSNGVCPKSARLKDPSQWEGENYLRKLLMELRSEINSSIY
uniref:NADAR domain-containing protein n=1 Tax=Meloidogyne enterolobii TaxID=390850 RepID=A0A6V7WFE1_MELEN|nr:unnamed protein product [Meloidogyne enterolobii]